MQIKLAKNLPDELLYGRVGFLWACLFLNKHLGPGTVPSTYTVSLPTPLVFLWPLLYVEFEPGEQLINRGCVSEIVVSVWLWMKS